MQLSYIDRVHRAWNVQKRFSGTVLHDMTIKDLKNIFVWKGSVDKVALSFQGVAHCFLTKRKALRLIGDILLCPMNKANLILSNHLDVVRVVFVDELGNYEQCRSARHQCKECLGTEYKNSFANSFVNVGGENHECISRQKQRKVYPCNNSRFEYDLK